MASLLVMGESFYTSTEASKITGCSRRQLQYWRKQGVVVPTVNPGGKGRNVYYSELDLLSLSLMKYLLSRGLNFEASLEILTVFKENNFLVSFENWQKIPSFLSLEPESNSIHIHLLFQVERIKEELKKAHPIIPVFGECIYHDLQTRLKDFHKNQYRIDR